MIYGEVSRLREDIDTLNVCYQRNLIVELIDARNILDFWSSFDLFIAEARANKESPILDIECHGDCAGLELADGSFIPWAELTPKLLSFNQATRCNLFVILAACDGANLYKVFSSSFDRAPFWGMLGPARPVAAGQLASFLRKVYTELLSGNQGLEAILTDQENFLMTSETLFKHAYARNLKKCNSADILSGIVDSLHKNFPHLTDAELHRALRTQMRVDFLSSYEKFFMLDLYPENAHRFSVSFDDVMSLTNS